MVKVIDFIRFIINYFTILKKITEFAYYITFLSGGFGKARFGVV